MPTLHDILYLITPIYLENNESNKYLELENIFAIPDLEFLQRILCRVLDFHSPNYCLGNIADLNKY
jgi:hypothetical protein